MLTLPEPTLLFWNQYKEEAKNIGCQKVRIHFKSDSLRLEETGGHRGQRETTGSRVWEVTLAGGTEHGSDEREKEKGGGLSRTESACANCRAGQRRGSRSGGATRYGGAPTAVEGAVVQCRTELVRRMGREGRGSRRVSSEGIDGASSREDFKGGS